jgi:UDP-glucose 4-epimerase
MKVLITGGAGYIGSITNRTLRDAGHETVIFDNLSTGHKAAVGDTELLHGDLRNPSDISGAFSGRDFDTVIHFAAMALAGESMRMPYEYYRNNIMGGLNLLQAMTASGVRSVIFSSTCAVYGYPERLPVSEDEQYRPVSVYGSSKRMFEEILEWFGSIHGIRFAQLRYFNAAGALPDGSLGEDHPDESHIIPIAIGVAMGRRPVFELFGNNYKTADGTCVRDYIHVMDLAKAHILAAERLADSDRSFAVNLGVGRGYSNMEVLDSVRRVSGRTINVVVKERRPGDPDAIYADNRKAKEILNWQPEYPEIDTIVESAWKWHSSHPEGFNEEG